MHHVPGAKRHFISAPQLRERESSRSFLKAPSLVKVTNVGVHYISRCKMSLATLIRGTVQSFYEQGLSRTNTATTASYRNYNRKLFKNSQNTIAPQVVRNNPNYECLATSIESLIAFPVSFGYCRCQPT